MKFKDWIRLQKNRLKLVALILKQVPQMLMSAGLASYVATRPLQKWIQNNIMKIIPTEIDNRIIEFDQKMEDKYLVPIAQQISDKLINDIKHDPNWVNLLVENDMLKTNAQVAKADRTAAMKRELSKYQLKEFMDNLEKKGLIPQVHQLKEGIQATVTNFKTLKRLKEKHDIEKNNTQEETIQNNENKLFEPRKWQGYQQRFEFP
jgi:hypothetical protein